MVQPLDGPQTLVALRLRGNTFTALDAPDLGLAIMAAAQQELSAPVPVQAHYPRSMTCEICDLFSTLRIVQCDDTGISGCCEVAIRRAELDAANGLDEAR